MNKRFQLFLILLALFVLTTFSYSQAAQEKADQGKVVGTWKIEVDADGEYYYLTMELKDVAGKLEGTISESQGTFTNVPLSELLYDGTTLSFVFKSPTPPDGVERTVRGEFKAGADKMDGAMLVTELGVTAPATATLEKK